MIRTLLYPGLLNLGLLAVALADGQMRVTADAVNVRCGPGTQFELVCQVNEGDRVTVRRTTEAWAEIEPPANARLWVYADLIDNDIVIASRVQIRSGPGISYRPAGKLDQGYKVTVEERAGDWVRIAPPKQASVWISRDYLDDAPVSQPPADLPEETAPASSPTSPSLVPPASSEPSPGKAPVVAVDRDIPAHPVSMSPPSDDLSSDASLKPIEKRDDNKASALPVALRGRRLAADRRQGAFVILEGEIASARGMWGKLSAFRLIGHDARGRTITHCYLLGNAGQLESIVGRRASIEGHEYWVDRVRYPGVRPERIRLYPDR